MEHWMTAQPRRVVLKGHKDAVNDARFSPDDIHITSASRDGSIRLWPVPVSSRVAELSESHCWPSAHQGQAVYAVRFSKDSSRIVSGGGDCHVRVWDLKSKKQLMELKCDGQILVVAVHQAPQLGEVFASGDLGGKISVWISRSSTGPPTLRWKSAAHTSRVRCIAFSPDGLRLASGSWDETAKIWDVLSGAELASMRHGGAVNGLAFVSNGAQLFTASACDDDREAPALYLWDANTEESTVVELKATHAEAARLKRRLEMAEQSAQLLQGQLETAVQLSDAHLQTLSAAQLKELADRLHREARRVDETHVEKKCKEAAEAARRAAAAEVEDAKTCIVCSERSVEITLQPCGHSTLCEQCALLLWNSSRQCPVDRIAFTEYKRIRLPY
eukprot:tig00020553_g10677.t1